ncbi:MAG: N-acetyl-gamma-glutamyl-phosphate reductase [Planctomycetota bacterium]|nr:MAG: N-acetyl-gamma-glutamyl-phosphate reductase [Planctomycetota bacterium]
MIRAGIVGGTGYGGMELLRLSLQHPQLEVVALTSRSEHGPVGAAHPHLRGLVELEFDDRTPQELGPEVDVLFLATPHGAAASAAHAALSAAPELRVIDLSGAHRLADPALHAAAYGFEHPHPERSAQAIYGLPECGARELVADARLVANPGCHATAALLATWPLVHEGFVTGPMTVASATGSTGAGAHPGAGSHHPRRSHDYRPYRPLRHQHAPEIRACLAAGAEGEVPPLHLVPHSAPLSRGLLATAFCPVAPGREQAAVDAVHATYEHAPLVRVLDQPPAVHAVAGSCLADVSVAVDDGMVCVMVALDNLGHGMAGTAMQNANLMCGLPEATGLLVPGAGP